MGRTRGKELICARGMWELKEDGEDTGREMICARGM